MTSTTPRPTPCWFELLDSGQIESVVDAGLRHKNPRAQPIDYLKVWLKIAREFAYATHDDSWGELEKEFAIIIKRMVRAERDRQELMEMLQLLADKVHQQDMSWDQNEAAEQLAVARMKADALLARLQGQGEKG